MFRSGSQPPLSSSLEPLQICEILIALLQSPIVARLVLGADETVGTTATMGRYVQVASSFPDRLLHVAAGGFGSLEGPRLALGISKKAAQLATMRALTAELGGAPPISRRLQRLCDSVAQVRDTGDAQALHRGAVFDHNRSDHLPDGGNQNRVEAIGLWPSQ